MKPDGSGGRKAPGSGASTVHGLRLWNSIFSLLTTTRSRISLIWFSSKAGSAQKRAAKGVVWPMPLPFPELHVRRANRRQCDASRKLGINFLVLLLNSLAFLDRPAMQVMPAFGTPCNFDQWQVVKKLGKHVDQWNAEAAAGPSEMGRSAAKFENMETHLADLRGLAQETMGPLHQYSNKRGGLATSLGFKSPHVQVISHTKVADQHLAKDIEPERLKFWGSPTFDAAQFLDERNKQVYERPLDFASGLRR